MPTNLSTSAQPRPIQNAGQAAPDSTDGRLRQTLRHCSPDTFEAACAVRADGNPENLRTLAIGILGPFVSQELQPALAQGRPSLRLAEDLGVDSLALTEIGMLSEDVLLVSISNDELFNVRTLGDLEDLFERLLHSQPRPGMRLSPEHTTRMATAPSPSADRAHLAASE